MSAPKFSIIFHVHLGGNYPIIMIQGKRLIKRVLSGEKAD